jgi:hypothetical protein
MPLINTKLYIMQAHGVVQMALNSVNLLWAILETKYVEGFRLHTKKFEARIFLRSAYLHMN